MRVLWLGGSLCPRDISTLQSPCTLERIKFQRAWFTCWGCFCLFGAGGSSREHRATLQCCWINQGCQHWGVSSSTSGRSLLWEGQMGHFGVSGEQLGHNYKVLRCSFRWTSLPKDARPACFPFLSEGYPSWSKSNMWALISFRCYLLQQQLL